MGEHTDTPNKVKMSLDSVTSPSFYINGHPSTNVTDKDSKITL